MKKLLALWLVCVLTMVTIAGCQNTNESTNQENNEKTSEVKEGKKDETASTGEEKLVTLDWYLGGSPQENQDEVFQEINKIMEEKIGVHVNFHFIDFNNYGQQMSMLLTSGTKIDLMFTSNWANDFYSDVSKGAYQSIDFEMVKEYGPNIIKEVPEGAWDAAKIKGELYAIPNVQVQARWPGLLLQNQYIDKYDFDVNAVENIRDFTPLLQNIADNEDGIYPIDIKKNTGILSFYLSKMRLEYFGETNPFGIRTDDEKLSVINIYETPEMKDFLYTLRDWYTTGIIRADAASVSDTSAEKQNGKLAAIFAVNNPDTVVNQARLMNMDPEDLTMVTLSEPYLSTSSVVATMTAINANSDYVKECIEVLNVMFDAEDTRCTNLLSYGIEGINYSKVEEDLIEIIPNTGYYVDLGWSYGSLFNCYRTNPLQPAWRPAGPDINKAAIVSPMMGFSLDSSSIKSEMAQISAVMDEFIPALLTGTVDVDELLPTFLEKLNNAGAEKVQQEIERQIDEWKSSN